MSPARANKIARGRGLAAARGGRGAWALSSQARSLSVDRAAPPVPRPRGASASRVSGTPGADPGWDEFYARQQRAVHSRDEKASALRARVEAEEAGVEAGTPAAALRQPRLSAGTRRIPAEMHSRGASAPATPADAPAPVVAAPVPATAASARRAGSVAGGTDGVAAGEALYRNAMNRVARMARAAEQADWDAAEARRTVRTNASSQALLRARLAREAAAAAVFIAAQHTAATPATAPAPDVRVLPWWLLPLSPPAAAAVLNHTGFLSGAALPDDVAVLAAAIATSSDLSPPLPPSNASVSGASNDAITAQLAAASVPPHLLPAASLFAHAWRALQYTGTPTDGDRTGRGGSIVSLEEEGEGGEGTSVSIGDPVPMVRLLALLQALVAAGYDVRIATLEAAAAAIGMANPMLTLSSYSSAAAAAAGAGAGVRDGGVPALAPAPPPIASLSSAAAPPASLAAMPPAFSSAVAAHVSRLRALAANHTHDGGDAGGGDADGSSEAEVPPPPAATGLYATSDGMPRLAEDVLSGSLVWPTPLLTALRRLYTNRLAYIGALTRTDTAGDLAVAAAVDVVVPPPAAAAAAVPAAAARLLALRDRWVMGARPAPPATAEETECTFAPMLCRRSLALAAARDGSDEMGTDAAPSAAASVSRMPREFTLLHYGAKAAARAAQRRAAAYDAEMEECTFRPEILRTTSTAGVGGSAPGSSAASVVSVGGPAASGRPRFESLHAAAALRAQAAARHAAEVAAAREAAELAACTFHPTINASPRARTAATHLAHALAGSAAPPSRGGGGGGRPTVAAAELLPRVQEGEVGPGHSAARVAERAARRSLLAEMTHALDAGELNLADDLAAAGATAVAGLNYVLLPPESAPPPAQPAYRDPWTPASPAPHASATPGRRLPVAAPPPVAPSPPAAVVEAPVAPPPAAPPSAAASAAATSAQPSGYRTHMQRMAKVAAERALQAAMAEALAAGRLHTLKSELAAAGSVGRPARSSDGGKAGGARRGRGWRLT